MSDIFLNYAGNIAILEFGGDLSEEDQFNIKTLTDFAEVLDELSMITDLGGLVICSSKTETFIAGENIEVLSVARGGALTQYFETGQALFNRLADLPFPTVAAINGSCMGGCFELALACDWRIAGDGPETRVGLPQTSFGFIPAWGGCGGLPRMLGLQEALSVILSGASYSAHEAKSKKLVDEVVAKEHLQSFGLSILGRGKRQRTHNPIMHNPAVAAVARLHHQNDVQKNTSFCHPAALAAVDVATASIGRTRAKSQQAEIEAVLKLVSLPETGHLMKTFLLEDHAKKQLRMPGRSDKVRRIAVIGAGYRGAAIAHSASQARIDTILEDDSLEELAEGMNAISLLYHEAMEAKEISEFESARRLDRVHVSAGKVPLVNCDLVIETSSLSLEERLRVFADLSSRSREDTILATNSLAQPVSDLVPSVTFPERLIGIHFFKTVHGDSLVEVVRSPSTSDETLATAVQFVHDLGKVPIVVRDAPGFLVNRVLVSYVFAAIRLFEGGRKAEEIDEAMVVFGMAVGPLRFIDECGLDVVLKVGEIVATAFPERFAVPETLRALVAAGHIGCKSGRGFYRHGTSSSSVNPLAKKYQTGRDKTPESTQQVLLGFLGQETRICLEEGIASSAGEIDLAIILAAGFPAYRGGPLSYREFH